MQYRTLPKTGENISVLGYGCMRFPTKMGGEASALIDVEATKAQLRYAIDNGVNYLDTAYIYHLGASESFLGEHILCEGYREKVKIATKLPCYLIHRREQFWEIFNKQMAKLRIDCCDFYLLHAIDGSSFDKMVELGVIDFMNQLKAQGRVRNMGFSYHGTREDFFRIVDSYDWDFTQVQYNLLDEHFQAGIEGIRYAAKKGLGVFIMEPLRGGTLVGKLPAPVQQLYDSAPIQHSPADWALRFIWNLPEVTCVLSGMNDLVHIKENIQTACQSMPNSLTATEQEILSKVSSTYDRLLTIKCTGCAYCLPCPVGINIPSCMKNLNNAHMFSPWKSTWSHTLFSGIRTGDGKPHWASSCIQCGACEKKCPQGLPIRDTLVRVSKEMENPLLKAASVVGRKYVQRRSK